MSNGWYSFFAWSWVDHDTVAFSDANVLVTHFCVLIAQFNWSGWLFSKKKANNRPDKNEEVERILHGKEIGGDDGYYKASQFEDDGEDEETQMMDLGCSQ